MFAFLQIFPHDSFVYVILLVYLFSLWILGPTRVFFFFSQIMEEFIHITY